MEIQINQIIGLNRLQYVNMVDGQFNTWCEHLSSTFYVPMRELQTNTKLYNWFLKQWDARIAIPFLQENQGFIIDGLKDTDLFFDLFLAIIDSPNGMLGIYPASIIKLIKKEHYKTLNK